jgi:hypothetical protein
MATSKDQGSTFSLSCRTALHIKSKILEVILRSKKGGSYSAKFYLPDMHFAFVNPDKIENTTTTGHGNLSERMGKKNPVSKTDGVQ